MALTTKYCEKLNKSTPLYDYPRPQLVRGSYFCLNGTWDFSVNKRGDTPLFNEKILVPFPPESALSGIERTHKKGEALHYRRTFTLPFGFIRDRVILHFGAVDQICEVWLNGSLVGEHEGGYLPFSFDVTEYISADDENELYLLVIDDLSTIYPYGKQTKKRGGMWYTEVSGIWQTIWLESVPESYIKDIRLTPTLNDVTIEVLGGANEKTLTLKDSGEVFTFEGNSFIIEPKKKRLWTPEDPYLYYFTLRSGEDELDGYFALREIGVKEIDGVTRLTLNGEPYLFHGLLDQGYFPDGIYIPATYEGYKDDIITAKSLGFNTLRKHIKIEPLIFYHLCDSLGMVVFQDMVNNSDYSFIRDTALPTVFMKNLPDKLLHRNKESRRIFTSHMLKTADLLYNTPSVLYYTIFNEGWGQFSADEQYGILKDADKTRIIDSTSGWFKRKRSDVTSHHVYFKALRAAPEATPVVISEFGGYSYRVNGHLFGEKNYGYRSFGTREEFVSAVKGLYLDEALPLVKKCVSALIYTQVSDVEDETNGFMTYDRRITKITPEEFLPVSEALIRGIKEKKI